MFESIIAYVLNKFLSGYIDEVDYNNLKLGLFSGTFELNNVKIKPSALYQFDVPIEVKYGTIGKLKINISYTQFTSQPAIAIVEDVFVLLAPFEDNKYDSKRFDEVNGAHKHKLLSETEKIDSAQIFEPKEKGYIDKMSDTIINNIQIYIKNVHIRYEDKYSIKDECISFGFYLKEFRAETIDAFGKSNFSASDDKIIYKLGALKGFNFYWNISQNMDSLISTQNMNIKANNWNKLLKESIYLSSVNDVKFDKFLENDLDLDTKLTLRRSYAQEDFNLPKVIVESSVSSIDLLFQRRQYKSIIDLFEVYKYISINKQFVKYRPKTPIVLNATSNEKYKNVLWWKYAFTAHAESKWRSYRPERIKKHWSNYKLYLKQYEQKLRVMYMSQELQPIDAKKLESLENDLLFESILDARVVCKERIKADILSGKLFNKNAKGIINDIEKVKELVGYTNDDFGRDGHAKTYTELRVVLNFPHIGLKLKTKSLVILSLSFTNILTLFEIRPVTNTYFFMLKTRSIDIDGIYYRDKISDEDARLVRMVSSQKSESTNHQEENVLFKLCIETNPIEYQNADLSVRATIHSLEAYYERTTINELIKFFRTDYLDLREINLRSDVWSTAGVSYAVENHKQVHVHATLSSPYFIIPVKGTSLEDGDLIVFYLGTTSIESRLQPKRKDYLPSNIQDLQSTFYDEFSLTIKQVQAILVDSKVDWKTYLNRTDKKDLIHHLINPIDTENKLYLSINAKYHKVPVLKLDTEVAAIKVNLSDKRIMRLFDFVMNFKQPDFALSKTDLALNQQAINTSQQQQQQQQAQLRRPLNKRESQPTLGDLPDEPDDEWEGPFRLPTFISGNPIANYPTVAFNFKINKFSINLSTEHTGLPPQEYLQLLLTNIEMKLAVTKYGQSFKAELGDLKLNDKKHNTEVLSSKAAAQQRKLISLYFRSVEKEAPNFETIYHGILRNILFKCNALQVVCHRTAFVNFLNYAKSITDNLKLPTFDKIYDQDEIKKKLSLDLPTKPNNHTLVLNESQLNSQKIDLNLIAEMEKFTWIMHDTSYKFGFMDVNRLKVNYSSCGIKMCVGVKLNEIIINYTGDSHGSFKDYYRQIISCTGIKNDREFLRFRLTIYDTSNLDLRVDKTRFQDSIDLTVGQIKLIGLLKFVNELRDFFDPFINPLPYLTEQMSEKAAEAATLMYTKYQENETSGRHILLNVQISSPRVIIPQNSTSMDAFSVSLGNLRVTNSLDTLNQVDDIQMNLENVQVKRIQFDTLNNENILEQVVDKIQMEANMKRALRKVKTADIQIDVKINNLTSTVDAQCLALIFSILNENLNEGIDPLKELERQNAAAALALFANNKPELKQQSSSLITPSANITLSINVNLNQIKLLIIRTEEKKRDDKNSVSTPAIAENKLPVVIKSKQSTKLGDFQIQEIKVKYTKYEDNKWNAILTLKKVFLDDVRPNSNFVVKQMFVPLSDQDIITLMYEEENLLSSRLTVGLDNLRVNLCLPYLLELYSMAMDAFSKSMPKTQLLAAAQTESQKQVPIELVQMNEKNFCVSANINLREVILFAEPEKKENSKTNRVLKLQTRVNLEYEAKSGDQNASIYLTQLEIILADFAQLDRKGTHFLLPTESKLTMIQKKNQKIPQFKAHFNQMVLNMTPSLYQIVMGVINSINMTGTENADKRVKNEQMNKEAIPFKEASINTDELFKSFEASDGDTQNSLSSNKKPTNETQVKAQSIIYRSIIETLHLVINEFMIIFCEENPGQLQAHAIVSLQLDGKVSNWTSNLHVDADLTLEAIYYNDFLNTWEPLIETVMEQEDSYRPWILSLCFAMEPGRLLQPPEFGRTLEKQEFKPIELRENESEFEVEKVDSVSRTANFVFVKSNDILNVNITPSGYKVMMYLMKITTAAGNAEGLMDNTNRPLQNIKINNYMGIKSTLWVSPKLKLRSENALDFHLIKTNNFGDETLKNFTSRQVSKLATKPDENDKYKVMIQVNGYEKYKLSIKTDGTYLVALNELGRIDNKMNIVYRVVTNYGRSKVIFSSPLQIENKSKSELKIFIKLNAYQSQDDVNEEKTFKLKKFKDADTTETFTLVFTLKPSKIYYVPCNYAYDYSIYVSPDPNLYYPSLIFDLKSYNLKTNVFDNVIFNSMIEMDDNFVLLKQLTLNVKQYRYVMLPTMHCNYRILLYTPIVLVNSLPFPLRFDIDELKANSKLVESGHTLNVCLQMEKLRNCKIFVDNYLNESWFGSLRLNDSKKDDHIIDLSVSPSTSAATNTIVNKHLKIHLTYEHPNEYIFYSPYWIINKTGQNLRMRALKSPIIFDVPNDENILLFDLKPKQSRNPFKVVKQAQNKAQIQVNNGDWSVSFGLDAAGTNGFLKCTDDILNYNFLIRVTMSNSSRTKLITLAPYLMIVNQTKASIEIAENREKMSLLKWLQIESIEESKKSVPFWPEYHEFKNLQFKIRAKKNNKYLTSMPFPLENPGRFVLLMREFDDAMDTSDNNEIYTVIISGGSQNPISLIIQNYKYSDSVAKIVNLCDNISIQVQQKTKEKVSSYTVGPQKFSYFIWNELLKRQNRVLLWRVVQSSDEKFNQLDINKSFKSQINVPIRSQDDTLDEEANANASHRDSINTQSNLILEHIPLKNRDDAKRGLLNLPFPKSNKKTSKNETVYFVSYMEEEQRIILFTTNEELANLVIRKESSTLEIFTAIGGIQVSVINNNNLEIVTLSITGSHSSWTMVDQIGTKKIFSNEYSDRLEQEYKNYIFNQNKLKFKPNDNNTSESPSFFQLDAGGERYIIDFALMTLSSRNEFSKLERFYVPGLSLQYRTSETMQSIKCCVFRLQIDNQLPDAFYPVCMYNAPNLLAKQKPFIEIGLYIEQNQNIQYYRHFDFIMQEFFLKFDLGFVVTLLSWYRTATEDIFQENLLVEKLLDKKYEAQSLSIEQDRLLSDNLKADIQLSKEILDYADTEGTLKQSSRIFFDFLLISPIVCNVSYNLANTANTDDKIIDMKIINFFLDTVGLSAIAASKDARIRFTSFMRQNELKTWDDLYNECFEHYKIQAIQQFYVILLGLDLIGNPVGLVNDLSQGFTDLFYDPLMGYIVSEDSKKLNYSFIPNLKTTVNRTISSAAGSFSRITGSLGSILATVSFDKEYKKKRQYKLSKTFCMPLKDTFAIAGKGVIAGVIYGLSGVIYSPVKECKRGIPGIIKGIGKGTLGLVAKPIGSLFDGASLTLEGIQRLAQSGSEVVTQNRLPRHLLQNMGIQPYSEYQAQGFEILRDLQNDDIAVDEVYWAHIFLDNKKQKTILFITDCNIYQLKKSLTQILKKWELLEAPINLFQIQPQIQPRTKTAMEQIMLTEPSNKDELWELVIKVPAEKSRKNDGELFKIKVIAISDVDTIRWINTKIQTAIDFYNESKGLFSSLEASTLQRQQLND